MKPMKTKRTETPTAWFIGYVRRGGQWLHVESFNPNVREARDLIAMSIREARRAKS